MSISVQQSQEPLQPQGQTEQEQQEFQTEAQRADQQIKEYYNNLGTYSAPSMDNICDLYNSGHTQEGDHFHKEHMSFCDLYGNAAIAFGNVLRDAATKTINDIKNAVNAIKVATEKAINGLKNLIQKEEAVIEANSDANGEKTSVERDRQNLAGYSEVSNPQYNPPLDANVTDRQMTKKAVNDILAGVNIDLSSLPENIQEDLINKYTNMVNFANSNNLRYYNTETLNERLIRYAQTKIGYTTDEASAYLRSRDAEAIREQFHSTKTIGKDETIAEYYDRLKAESKS